METYNLGIHKDRSKRNIPLNIKTRKKIALQHPQKEILFIKTTDHLLNGTVLQVIQNYLDTGLYNSMNRSLNLGEH